jgi:hypothetical protein
MKVNDLPVGLKSSVGIAFASHVPPSGRDFFVLMVAFVGMRHKVDIARR